jgi:hypothetical protein
VEFLFGWGRSWRPANLVQTLCQKKPSVTPDFETFLHHASDSAAPVAPVRRRRHDITSLELARPAAKLVNEGGSCGSGAAAVGASDALFAASALAHSGHPGHRADPKESDSCPPKTKSAKHQSSSTQR